MHASWKTQSPVTSPAFKVILEKDEGTRVHRANFREIRDRFRHIDAAFVRARCEIGDGPSEYVVRFYPWWEHPEYLRARRHNEPWSFADTRSGAKEVSVRPVAPIAFHLTRQAEVIEWDFPDHHKLLWDYEATGHIACNSDFSQRELIDRVMDRGLPGLDRRNVYEYLDCDQAQRAPYSLGYFPLSLFRVLRDVLIGMDVEIVGDEPPAHPMPSLFLINGTDYIIAADFEIELPEFEHLDEWYGTVAR